MSGEGGCDEVFASFCSVLAMIGSIGSPGCLGVREFVCNATRRILHGGVSVMINVGIMSVF